MRNIHIVTCGQFSPGYDPHMTEEGRKQIRHIRTNFLPQLADLTLVISGTGSRFLQTFSCLFPTGFTGNVMYSPFCGNVDVITQDDQVILTNREIPKDEYLGLVETPGFYAWEFVSRLPKGTLICAGEEFMLSLAIKSLPGQLYSLDIDNKSSQQIS
jgi:hypothetical protein